MSTEQNKALIHQFVEELINQGKLDIIDEIVSPDFVEHEALPPGIPPSREAPRAMFGMLQSAFPDLHATIEHLIAEDDKVVAHMTWAGTQEGEFMGIPPTGKHMSINVMDIFGIAGGQIVDHWGVSDMISMMQQLGLMPE
jgi:steroid delta-isomerase-like uncharacterized protein